LRGGGLAFCLRQISTARRNASACRIALSGATEGSVVLLAIACGCMRVDHAREFFGLSIEH